MAVGALCWQNSGLEPFSSQGPTIDGRTKPDISGFDGVSGTTYGNSTGCSSSTGFFGTSASSPNVAGAAALLKQQNPAFGPDELQSLLESKAQDLGTAGKDDLYGAGKLLLGPAPVVFPTITSFSPASGAAESSVTMRGWGWGRRRRSRSAG